ncbi:MAG: protein phosphatase 2C domain-containing protein [Pyrinomonadaceae bacterium]
MIVELHAKTDVGRVRKGNEDNFLALDLSTENGWTGSDESVAPAAKAAEKPDQLQHFAIGAKGAVFVVSDGMGGALAGEVASHMAVDTVREHVLGGQSEDQSASDSEMLTDALRSAAEYANLVIHRRSQNDPECSGMGATLTGAAVTSNNGNPTLSFVQVGDSRAYLIRGEQIKQTTKDQSLVQQLVDAGQITQEEAEHHMFRNVILQALGAQAELAPVVCRIALRRDDILVMCSDGLSGKLNSEDIRQIVAASSDDLSEACDNLITLANERGGEDNITVIIARFTGDDLSAHDDEPITVEFSEDDIPTLPDDEPTELPSSSN